ncbi:MAG: hypothetical protein WCD54_29320 [Pseudolabrys sp.]
MSRKIPLAVGFANFSGEDFALLASEDLAISPLFETTIVATTQQIPRVDVIFIYARFAASGALEQSSQTVGVRQIAHEARSRVLISASAIPEDIAQKVMKFPGPATANLIFTLDRKGAAFARFFCALFERMRRSEDMLYAWVELAPQAPMDANDNPELVLLPEAGAITFPP